MATTIKLKNSVTTTNAPSSLVQGEVAINITDKKVWVGNAATTPIQLLGDGGSASFTSIAFGAGTVSNPSITFTGDTNTGIYSPAADTIAFTEGGVEAMRIDSSGNVGIGTSSPSTQLQMNSSAATYSDQLRIRNTNFGNADIGVGSGIMAIATDMANITFYTSSNLGTTGSSVPSNERMRIDSSGNVGIGTSSPSTFGNPNNRGITVNGQGTAGFVEMQSSGTAYGAVYANSSNAGIRSITALPLTFETNSTERMRIDSSGNLLVGTTNSSIGKFAVNGDAYIDTYLGIGTTPTSDAMINIAVALNVPRSGILIQSNQSPASGSFIEFQNLSGNVAGSITHTGTTTVAYNTSSDYRLKENIAPMTGALAKVQALKPCTYTWKEDGSAGQGFIAHELAEVVPQAVTGEKDAVDKDGKIKPQGIDTSFLVATLTAAIQEQQTMIEELKQEVAKLKGV